MAKIFNMAKMFLVPRSNNKIKLRWKWSEIYIYIYNDARWVTVHRAGAGEARPRRSGNVARSRAPREITQ